MWKGGRRIIKQLLGTKKDYYLEPETFIYKWLFTPWKINMEPTHHSFRKDNDLPNLYSYVPC